MKIDLTNYEAFLLDYSEGNLDAGTAAELILFMEQHPDLQVDLEELSSFILEAQPELENDFKNRLKKDNEDLRIRFEELCISFYDRNISADDKKELDFILQQNPYWEKEFQAFGKTYLESENSIVFDNKEILKKEFTYEGSFDRRAVLALEGEMSEVELKKFNQEIQSNAQLSFYWEAFMASRLIPETIIFAEKESLYQSEKRRIIPIWSVVAAAASVVLLIGIFALFNRDSDVPALSALKQDRNQVIRKAVVNEGQPVIDFTIQEIHINKPGNKKAIIISPGQNERILMPELADISPRSISVTGKSELETRYISSYPGDLSVTEENETAENSNRSLSPGQFLLKGARKMLKRNNIAIESPIEEIRQNGLGETSMKGIERISRGNVSFQHDQTGNRQRVTGFSIGGLGYSRSSR